MSGYDYRKFVPQPRNAKIAGPTARAHAEAARFASVGAHCAGHTATRQAAGIDAIESARDCRVGR